MDDRFDPYATPLSLAQPLIERFTRSPECPLEHRWHARTTLPVLALYVSMSAAPTDAGPAWEALDPDALVRSSLDAEMGEPRFLRDLLDVSAAFYRFLAREAVVSERRALELRVRLTVLALGLPAA